MMLLDRATVSQQNDYLGERYKEIYCEKEKTKSGGTRLSRQIRTPKSYARLSDVFAN